jgi:hypothetical protein
VEGDFGKALLKLSQHSLKDDGMVISKAARIVRKALFEREEIFDGDLSNERQKSSVAGPLLHLMSLILNGESSFEEPTSSAEVIALLQLVRFN